MAAQEIVIDTSAILAVLLSEPERGRLLMATRGADLWVPPSVPWEVGNALAALVKRRRLAAADALSTIHAFEQIPLRHVAIDLGRAVQCAAELGTYAYDAYLLEATRVRGCALLTLDRALARAADSRGLEVLEVEQ